MVFCCWCSLQFGRKKGVGEGEVAGGEGKERKEVVKEHIL